MTSGSQARGRCCKIHEKYFPFLFEPLLPGPPWKSLLSPSPFLPPHSFQLFIPSFAFPTPYPGVFS